MGNYVNKPKNIVDISYVENLLKVEGITSNDISVSYFPPKTVHFQLTDNGKFLRRFDVIEPLEIERVIKTRKMLGYLYHNLDLFYPVNCKNDKQLNLVHETYLRLLCSAVFFENLDHGHFLKIGNLVKDIYPEMRSISEINDVFKRLITFDLPFLIDVKSVIRPVRDDLQGFLDRAYARNIYKI